MDGGNAENAGAVFAKAKGVIFALLHFSNT
jgi:hypothetical protein